MIITKTRLRISFAGGGTDLAAKYSSTELVERPEDIQHPLIREALLYSATATPLEITSFADIPAEGSGLGSSSAFCVGLVHALTVLAGKHHSSSKLAEMACTIEIDRLKGPIGKQDQYASAVGGFNYLKFHSDGTVFSEAIPLSRPARQELEKSLLLFYTGVTRSAKSILTEQRDNTHEHGQTRTALLGVRRLAEELKSALCRHDLTSFGDILHKGWLLKKQFAGGVSNSFIDEACDAAMAPGALGGKLLGAGGCGFLLVFYASPERQAAVCQAPARLRRVNFSFDVQGTRIAHLGT
jgi:D-glycero-alpha-D-manno-heptose-7-phosphate kinase